MNEITRADALKFRAWWSARVEGGLSANSANKQFDQLREIFTTWSNLAAPGLDNPFSGLSLKRTEMNRTPPFTQLWIKDHILAPGALANLNAEAAGALLVLINTGLRPSEVTDAPLGAWRQERDAADDADRKQSEDATSQLRLALMGGTADAAPDRIGRGLSLSGSEIEKIQNLLDSILSSAQGNLEGLLKGD